MKKIESGVYFEGYKFVIGSKYIHAVSTELGKKNEKQLLTEAGKEQARWIAENTEFGDIRRHNLMGRIWHNPEYSREI
jgi:hypothetical protein